MSSNEPKTRRPLSDEHKQRLREHALRREALKRAAREYDAKNGAGVPSQSGSVKASSSHQPSGLSEVLIDPAPAAVPATSPAPVQAPSIALVERIGSYLDAGANLPQVAGTLGLTPAEFEAQLKTLGTDWPKLVEIHRNSGEAKRLLGVHLKAVQGDPRAIDAFRSSEDDATMPPLIAARRAMKLYQQVCDRMSDRERAIWTAELNAQIAESREVTAMAQAHDEREDGTFYGYTLEPTIKLLPLEIEPGDLPTEPDTPPSDIPAQFDLSNTEIL